MIMPDKQAHTAKRMQDIDAFYVMDILARARALEAQGRSIIHMEIGEPDFVTPEVIIEAGIRTLQQGKTHYTPALGLPALREAIAHYYQQRFCVDVSPDRIIITPGASGALQLALGILINPGDQVLMADPGYPCNRHFVRLFEGESKSIPVDSATQYQLNASLIDHTWTDKTVAALIASPSNPTGTILEQQEFSKIISAVGKRGGHLIVDEIYNELVYDKEAQTVLQMSDDVFVINSFSKYFCMTGWRIGWMVVPPPYVRAIDKLAQNIFLATSTLSQYAALAAFTAEAQSVLEERRREFKVRRDFLLPALRELGFDIPITPQGAFYLYAGCKNFTKDSYAFAMELLEKTGVAVTPGRDFGFNMPEAHIRFAYTTSLENLQEGVKRLSAYISI